MLAHNFPQPAADAVARHGPANCARGDESGLKRRIIVPEHAKNEKVSAMCAAVLLHSVEFGNAG